MDLRGANREAWSVPPGGWANKSLTGQRSIGQSPRDFMSSFLKNFVNLYVKYITDISDFNQH